MKNTYSISRVTLILLMVIFTVAPLAAQEPIIDENGYADIPTDGAIDFSGTTEYFQILNQTESSNPPNPWDDEPDAGVPVDGGLGFLLAAGLGYGANRLRKKREEKRNFDK